MKDLHISETRWNTDTTQAHTHPFCPERSSKMIVSAENSKDPSTSNVTNFPDSWHILSSFYIKDEAIQPKRQTEAK